LSLVLGGRETTLVEEATAYSVFANRGIKHDPYAILEVKDASGKSIYKHKNQQGSKILSEEIAFLVSHILLDDVARADGFGRYSLLNVPGKTVAVKTGTTDSKRDNWAIGYTPSYVVGVWVGNNDNSAMNARIASGVTGATPIWNKIMQAVLKDKKDEQFSKPSGVEAIQVDAFSGGTPRDGQPTRTEYFMKGTEPTTKGIIYKQVKISKAQGNKLANEEEIKRGDYDVKEYIVFEEQDPVSTDGKNRWQEAINTWLNEAHKDDSLYRPPTEVSDHKYDENPTPTPVTETPTPTFTPTPTP
jgi:membrane peptidoglycan carboxypeptidase